MQNSTLYTIPEETQVQIDIELSQAQPAQIEGLFNAIEENTQSSKVIKEVTEKLSKDERSKPFRKTMEQLKESDILGTRILRYVLKGISKILSRDKDIQPKPGFYLFDESVMKELENEINGMEKQEILENPAEDLSTFQVGEAPRVESPKAIHTIAKVLQNQQRSEFITTKQQTVPTQKPEHLSDQVKMAEIMQKETSTTIGGLKRQNAFRTSKEEERKYGSKRTKFLDQTTEKHSDTAKQESKENTNPEKSFADQFKEQAKKTNPSSGWNR
jgi:hypothetical protein